MVEVNAVAVVGVAVPTADAIVAVAVASTPTPVSLFALCAHFPHNGFQQCEVTCPFNRYDK